MYSSAVLPLDRSVIPPISENQVLLDRSRLKKEGVATFRRDLRDCFELIGGIAELTSFFSQIDLRISESQGT